MNPVAHAKLQFIDMDTDHVRIMICINFALDHSSCLGKRDPFIVIYFFDQARLAQQLHLGTPFYYLLSLRICTLTSQMIFLYAESLWPTTHLEALYINAGNWISTLLVMRAAHRHPPIQKPPKLWEDQ